MTDPVDQFFEREREAVPTLSPPPGRFDELQTVARHRRNRNTTMLSAAAAVVLAVAGTGAVLGAQNLHGSSTAALKPAGPTAKAAVSASAAPTVTSTSAPPVDATVPADFKAWSVSFVNGGTTGWALGGYGCSGGQQCVAVLKTTNAMATWNTIARRGFAAEFGMGASSIVRFSSSTNGWMVGSQGVYSTHDGGSNWRPIGSLQSAGIDALEAWGSHTYALGADGTALWVSSDPNADIWTQEPGLGLPAAKAGQVDSLVPVNRWVAAVRTQGSTTSVRYSGDNGSSWQTATSPCSAKSTRLFYLLSENIGRFVCANGQVYGGVIDGSKKMNRDATFQLTSSTGSHVVAESISHNDIGTVVSYSGAGLWAINARGQKEHLQDGDFGYVGLTNDTQGIALNAQPSHTYWISVTGGQTWRPASFG